MGKLVLLYLVLLKVTISKNLSTPLSEDLLYSMSSCGYLWVHLFESLWASWIWMSFSFPKLGKFSVIISSNRFSSLFSLSLHSGALTMQMLFCLIWSYRSLRLSSLFKILGVFFCCFIWVSSTALYFSSLILSSASSSVLLKPLECMFHCTYCGLGLVPSYSFSPFVEVFTVFIHSSPQFSEHLSDHGFAFY